MALSPTLSNDQTTAQSASRRPLERKSRLLDLENQKPQLTIRMWLKGAGLSWATISR